MHREKKKKKKEEKEKALTNTHTPGIITIMNSIGGSMMRRRSLKLAHVLGVFALSAALVGVGSGESTVAQAMERGFAASHSPTDAPFQPILSDPSGTFYLGFLRVGSSFLDLAVLHLPSSFPVWRAAPARPALWASAASLSFNGSLLLARPGGDSAQQLLWSSATGGTGDRVVLLASSDLQIVKDGGGGGVAWRSFDFPADTLVQDQNFTGGMRLLSPGRRFSMQLGSNYIGLYFVGGGDEADTMYWRHTALEAMAQVEPGGAPLRVRVEPEGFLGMYQLNGSEPADVIAFNTFNRNMTGRFRRLTLEDDANLHAYYWSGTGWVGEYTAIADACEIPTTCGAYSVCRPGAGAHQCTCLANGTDGCLATPTGDFCGGGGGGGTEFAVLRRGRVDLGNKEIMSPGAAGSVDECEGSCARNCSCWGAIYSNASSTCYQVDYPVQLLLQGDEWHVGYFKVRSTGGGGGGGGGSGGDDRRSKEEDEARRKAKVGLLVVGSLVLVAAAGFGAYKVWGRRRRRTAIAVDGKGLAQGPYKDLGKASFRSIEIIELPSSSSSSSSSPSPHS